MSITVLKDKYKLQINLSQSKEYDIDNSKIGISSLDFIKYLVITESLFT